MTQNVPVKRRARVVAPIDKAAFARPFHLNAALRCEANNDGPVAAKHRRHQHQDRFCARRRGRFERAFQLACRFCPEHLDLKPKGACRRFNRLWLALESCTLWKSTVTVLRTCHRTSKLSGPPPKLGKRSRLPTGPLERLVSQRVIGNLKL